MASQATQTHPPGEVKRHLIPVAAYEQAHRDYIQRAYNAMPGPPDSHDPAQRELPAAIGLFGAVSLQTNAFEQASGPPAFRWAHDTVWEGPVASGPP